MHDELNRNLHRVETYRHDCTAPTVRFPRCYVP